MRRYRHVPKPSRSDVIRLLRKTVVTPDGCWQWTGCIDSHGYARLMLGGSSVFAHRVSVAAFVPGGMPQELVTDHRCRNRACVNPMHLEPVTQRTNIIRGNEARALLTGSSEKRAQAIA